MNIRVARLGSQQVPAILEQICLVYEDSFSSLPMGQHEVDRERFAALLTQHLDRPGIRFYVAERIEEQEVVGFSYGYTGGKGDQWHDLVAKALEPEDAARWMGDCFDFIALAVRPRAHGHGIGGKLHDALLQGLDHRTAVLTTVQAQTSAVALYQKRGWVTLADGFVFPSRTTSYLILGLDLLAWQEARRTA